MAEDINKVIREILLTWTNQRLIDMQNTLRSENKIAKGILINSFVAEMISDTSSKISMVYYGYFVDQGRRPGKMPPLAKIKEWCEVKGIPVKFAFPIARNIGLRGIQGIFFTDQVHDKVDELVELIVKAIDEDIVATIKTALEKKS